MAHYVIADKPTINNPTPIRVLGNTSDLTAVTYDADTEVLVEITRESGVVLNTWQAHTHERINAGALFQEDTSNHRSLFYVHLINGVYEVIASEPPFISLMTHRATISGSLTT